MIFRSYSWLPWKAFKCTVMKLYMSVHFLLYRISCGLQYTVSAHCTDEYSWYAQQYTQYNETHFLWLELQKVYSKLLLSFLAMQWAFQRVLWPTAKMKFVGPGTVRTISLIKHAACVLKCIDVEQNAAVSWRYNGWFVLYYYCPRTWKV